MQTNSTLVALGITGLVLFLTVIFGELLMCALLSLIDSWPLAALITWSVCVGLFSAIAASASWVLRRRTVSPHFNINDTESPRHYIVWPTIIDEHLQRVPAQSREELPAYRTRVELLNDAYPCDTPRQAISSNVTAIVETRSDNYTFATSPFTSPPIFAIQIFVNKEEVVISEELIPRDPNQEASVLVDAGGKTAAKLHAVT